VRDGRTFALTLAGGFLVVGLLFWWTQRHSAASVSFALSAVCFLAGVLMPERLEPLRSRWLKLGELIGLVTTPVLMAALYYLVMTPAALLRRFRRPPKKPSGWYQREPLPPASRMERQF
jgi:hypothetical protein